MKRLQKGQIAVKDEYWKPVFPTVPMKCCAAQILTTEVIDGRVAGHLGAADGLKTLSIHVCICPHFGM